MVKIYLAAPLFSDAERDFNKKLRDAILKLDFSVFLPQEDSNNCEESEVENREIYKKNTAAIDNSDIVVAVLDGPDVDSGTAWEIGYAYANRKPVYGLKSDFRSMGKEGPVNLMIYFSLRRLCTSVEDMLVELNKDVF